MPPTLALRALILSLATVLAAPSPSQRTVEIEVVDHRGKPVLGVPIVVSRLSPLGTRRIEDSHTTAIATDANGKASVQIPRMRENSLIGIAPRILTARPIVEEFSASDLSAIPESLRFALPPFGSVRVYAQDSKGEPRKMRSARLSLANRRNQRFDARAQPEVRPTAHDDNSATFGFVELDLRVSARLRIHEAQESFSIEGTGPTRERELKVLSGDCANPSPLIRMRLVDRKGSALTRQPVVAVLAKPGQVWSQRVETGPNGELEQRIPRGFYSARLYVVRRGEDRDLSRRYLGAAQIDLPALSEGQTVEVERVALQEEPVLITGHVVDAAGKPLPDATVFCSASYAKPQDGRIFGDVPHLSHRVCTDENGRFELREMGALPESIALNISHDTHALPSGPIEVAPRASGLRIVMSMASELRGSFAPFPDGVSKWGGEILLWPEGADRDAKSALPAVQEATAFRFSKVAAGSYELGVFLSGARTASHIRSIVVPPGGGTIEIDPVVDWTEFCGCYRFEVVVPDGVRSSRVQAQHWMPRNDTAWSGGGLQRSTDKRYTAFASPTESRLVFRHRKCRPVVVKPPFRDSKITLERKAEGRFRVSNLPDLLGAKPRWSAHATPPKRGRAPFARSSASVITETDGILRIFSDDAGAHDLRLNIAVPTGERRFRMAGFSVRVELPDKPSDTVMEVAIPQSELEQLQATLEDLRDR